MRLSSIWIVAGTVVLACFSCITNVTSAQDSFAPETQEMLTGPLVADSSCTTDACRTDGSDLFGGSTGDDCNLGPAWSLFDSEGPIDIGGWFQFGYHTKDNLLFNTRPEDLQLQQGWIYAEKAADSCNGPDWGFRIDLMYGTDAGDTQAFGNNRGTWDFQNGYDHGADYGWAIPQAYFEIAKDDWSIIAGHFYTLVGYEVVTAPDNFFYSHSYTMFNSEPFTHTGLLGTWTVSESIEFYGGWTAGWDTGFDQFGDGSAFLGGASVDLTHSTSLAYITSFGDLGRRNSGNNSYGHSIVLDTAVSDKLNWVLQSDYLDAGADPAISFQDKSYGLNNYLVYAASNCLGYGLRTEWWRNGGFSFYEVTAGINYRPHANLIVRPEIRHDWSPALDIDRTTLAIDAIITF